MLFRGLVLLALFAVTSAGRECTVKERTGQCTSYKNCKSAQEEKKKGINPTTCWHQGYDHIVCCFNNSLSQPTEETEWREENYINNEKNVEPSCPPISANLTATKIGQKAWDMCLEYQERLYYPCVKNEAPRHGAEMRRANYCLQKVKQLILGGTNANKNEFPHMVLLGFAGDGNVKWNCGGSLISDRFILTAGHCIRTIKYGEVTHAYVGALKRSEVEADPSRMYKIKTIHKHPGYRSPKKYNDIALLELEKSVELGASAVPACLPVGVYNDNKVKATGWGLTAYRGATSQTLQKVDLHKFSSDECYEAFDTLDLERGFDAEIQLCYGDKNEAKDTCQGDSGGPIQIEHPKMNCMYMIVGVTSTGVACGVVGQPALYTRVKHYVPWIEGIVWP